MKGLILLIVAYLIGSVMTGHLLSKYYQHGNMKTEGSGNIGARNAGRLYGKKAFIITFIGDALKGVLVIVLASSFDFTVEWQLLALLAAICGHIYPITLGFHGGKGMSTFIGGFLTFSPQLFCVFLGVFLVLFLITRSLTVAGMTAMFFMPFIFILFPFSYFTFFISAAMSLLIIFKHRENLQEKINSRKGMRL